MSNFTSKIIKWEDSKFQSLNCSNNSAKQDLFGFIVGYAKEKKILDILDLGCGKGGQWNWYYSNNEKIDFQLNIYGYEPFKGNATSAIDKSLSQINFINNLKTCKKKFDVVVSMSVLEHVYDRKKFLENCKKFTKNGCYSLINYDNGHFHNPREWKRNIFGKFLAEISPIKRYYQDFVEIDKVIKLAHDMGMKVDDYLDYHVLIDKNKLNLLNLCKPETRAKLIDKIQIFEKEISNIINTKDNKLIHNKYSYSSTLILMK